MEDFLSTLNLDLRDCLHGARSLLGYKLVSRTPQGITSGYIVETEAYHFTDPASHSFIGRTKRNNSLFENSGTVYVYFTYGMHYCLNIVCGNRGEGQGVLIRALEPVEGMNLMIKRRNTENMKLLTNGPGKLTQALGVKIEVDGTNLIKGPISIKRGITPEEIVMTTRIGIKQAVEYPWRFYIKDNPFVSKIAKEE